MWGLAALSPGEPFTEASPASDTTVKRVMILLTDGMNTETHYRGIPLIDQSSSGLVASLADAATSASCTLVKQNNIEVFTIRLLDGDTSLLQNCASPDTSSSLKHYSDVQSQLDLSTAFNGITNSILQPRYTN